MVKEKQFFYDKESEKLQSENETLHEFASLADERAKWERLGGKIMYQNAYCVICVDEDEDFYRVIVLSNLLTGGKE